MINAITVITVILNVKDVIVIWPALIRTKVNVIRWVCVNATTTDIVLVR